MKGPRKYSISNAQCSTDRAGTRIEHSLLSIPHWVFSLWPGTGGTRGPDVSSTYPFPLSPFSPFILHASSFILFVLGVSTAWACDSGTVRDAAFHAPRDVHRLYLIANRDDADADAMEQRLETWLEGNGKDLNVELVRIAADDPSVRWTDYDIPSAPSDVPVVALIGQFPSPPRAFVIDLWTPGPSDEDLAVLTDSPVRQRIREGLLNYWAVVVLAAQAGDSAAAFQPMLEAVTKRWAEEQSPGVTVVRLDRTDPRERTLCSFAGIRPDGPVWAGVVFGRGRLLAPPLEGDSVTEAHLNQLIAGLAAQCTCLQESLVMGLDVPLTWNEALDAQVVALAPPQGYVEMTIDDQVAAIETQLEAEVPDEAGGVLAITLVPLALAALAALAAVALVVWRIRRQGADL